MPQFPLLITLLTPFKHLNVKIGTSLREQSPIIRESQKSIIESYKSQVGWDPHRSSPTPGSTQDFSKFNPYF